MDKVQGGQLYVRGAYQQLFAEVRRAVAYLDQLHTAPLPTAADMPLPRFYIVTGTAGIGKSVNALYLLIIKLSEPKIE